VDYIISEEELMKFNEFFDIKDYIKTLQPIKLENETKMSISWIMPKRSEWHPKEFEGIQVLNESCSELKVTIEKV